MNKPGHRRNHKRCHALLGPALLCCGISASSLTHAEILQASAALYDDSTRHARLLQLAEDPGGNRLLLGIEFDQPCPAAAAYCAPARVSTAAQGLGVPGLQVDLLLRQLDNPQSSVPMNLPQQLGEGSGTRPPFEQDDARPIAQL